VQTFFSSNGVLIQIVYDWTLHNSLQNNKLLRDIRLSAFFSKTPAAVSTKRAADADLALLRKAPAYSKMVEPDGIEPTT
jgi:hypothetical protein